MTSGADGIYPKGYAVGVVEKSERGSGLHRVITVRPAVDFPSLEEVLVVLVPARGATPAPPKLIVPEKPAAPPGAVK